MRYKNILFDLDGTITDSEEGVINSGRYALEQLGMKVPDYPEMRKMIGPPLRVSFPRLGVPEDKVDEAIRLYRELYNNHGAKYQCKVYSGIEELLKELKSLGCSLYVATSKPEVLARDIVDKFELGSYFEYVAGSTMDHARESKSDVLKYLLEIIGSSKEVVLIGDTDFDVIGARKQNIPCIGVSWGYGSVGIMEAAGAEMIVDSTEELLRYLKG